MVSDLADSKPFFMSVIRHPRMKTPAGFTMLLAQLLQMKKSPTYLEMRRQSAPRTEERTELKRRRNEARLNLRRGKRHHDERKDIDLARTYARGELTEEWQALELQYNTRRLQGMAELIGYRV